MLIDGSNLVEVEESLMSIMKDEYYKVLDFKLIRVFNKNIVLLDLFKDLNLESIGSFDNMTSEEILNEAISYVKEFDYSYFQNNPLKMVNFGKGNCQAMSIMLDEILQNCGLDSEIIVEDSHAFNRIKINNKIYNVDLANDIINYEEVN